MIKTDFYNSSLYTQISKSHFSEPYINDFERRSFGSFFSSRISTTYRGSLEEVLILTNPLVLVASESTIALTMLESLSHDANTSLANLGMRPSLKLEKKVKKSDKDDDRDIERANTKLKVKKKTRSKVTFEEEYESVTELFENEDIVEDKSLLPLARPPKPIASDLGAVTFLVKKKPLPTSTSQKKKSTNSQQKKDLESISLHKPATVTIAGPMTVQELSELFSVSKVEIIRSLFLKGIPVTVNQSIDVTTAQKLGEEFGVEVISFSEKGLQSKRLELEQGNSELCVPRPPIVTVMGHVDHGKTTLLDRIRKTQIAQKEAGGITQKIGAYEVLVDHKGTSRKIVFLDTPGHAAFSGMRSRGVSITDIAILVVAADDGVKHQTIEAIKYIQSAQVPIIVAINKIDKEDANVESIKEELTKYNLISEDWGGDTLMVPISAMQGTNIDNLLEMILLLSDVLGLQTNPASRAEGTIIESHLDRTRGAVASLIVQTGTLEVGDFIMVDGVVAKVRGMLNSSAEMIKRADPSSPIFLWGLSKVPSVGDHFVAFKSEKEAKSFINSNTNSLDERSQILFSPQLSDNYNVLDSENKERINLIIKTDSQGSAEAITTTLNKIDNSKVQLRVLYSSAGEITETDIEFASTSGATLLAFNTTLASGAKKTAKTTGITVKEFNVIYDLFDYVDFLIESLVGPQYEEKFVGSAIVKTVFPLAKSFVAGSFVREGKIIKESFVYIFREDDIVHKGLIRSLKRVKEDVQEVTEGSECGIFIDGFDTWKQGDIIKAFELLPKKKQAF